MNIRQSAAVFITVPDVGLLSILLHYFCSVAIKMSTKIMAMFLVMFVFVHYAAAASRHCTWHGTAPICFPSCPSDKFAIKENNCGKAKIACCVTGKKKLCCPVTLKGQITPEQAEAIAH